MAPKIKYPVVDGFKECGKCHLWLPLINYDKARNHYAALCKKCKSEWAILYRKKPENKKHFNEYHKKYMTKPKNRERSNERQRGYNKTEKYKQKKNTNRRKWAAEQKQKSIIYKGGKCIICGYDTCLAALDFHHPDPSKKNGYGTGALKSHWSFEKNMAELDKCILVCVRCHREIHAGVTKCPSVS